MSDKFKDIDDLLKGIVKPERTTLKQLFENKLREFKISPTAAYKIIDIQSRTIKGILNGSQKKIDITNLIKIANFLQIPKDRVVELYLDAVDENFPTYNISLEKIDFIKKNFDLAVLRKAGLINNITDFEHIEKRIVARLGLKSIYEYKKPSIDVAFSSGLFKPENDNTRAFWIKSALVCFEEIDNPYPYNRHELVKIFPSFRWHTMNVERGLEEIIKALYKIGVTVIFQPPMQKLQLRGATFNYNNKPCIVLTNYLGFYSTLWFALIHELYHVLFDWEEIKLNKYHLTDDSNEQLSVREREDEADHFAREYLLSKEKIIKIRPYLNDLSYVTEFAAENNIHQSFIYVFNAFDLQKNNRNAWAWARKFSPKVENSIKSIGIPWEKPVEESLKLIKPSIYK
ncbi:ImmA/IrrE family metallo-endopeptidase [Cyclobacterium plantarum]|uniref:ImmA/IrrE family metallo-endopeptidase n=1 Tax=Cyclobacterium plantarum TaxID=2716263 RepID=A0ABX0H4Q8_9BACT|nr:ImmA/IrrE family metallo-endopeptidase [Cyclobacterium plantarum]NHE56487.1 ImmA/IrrE family metallo-endopeptidase [Cyclobacterium plantarum]